MDDGYYLSTYYSIDKIGFLYDLLSSRHDMAIALWRKNGIDVELVRYWEFERLSRLKHHKLPFFDLKMAKSTIADLLLEEDLSWEDIKDIWGTSSPGKYEISSLEGFYMHEVYHLFSSMFIDTDVFYNNKVIALAVDLRADNENEKRRGNGFPEYVGSYSDCGEMQMFHISSPAILWNICRNEIGLQEGSLMALASATRCRVKNDIDISVEELTWPDYDYCYKVFDQIRSIITEETVCEIDNRFSLEENLNSAIMKEIVKLSQLLMKNEIEHIIAKYNIDPSQTYLSISGGYGLNCPSNTYLMHCFGFKGFLGAPCMDDSGEALGIGLLNFYYNLGKFNFKLQHAFYGKKYMMPDTVICDYIERGYIVNVSDLDPQTFVNDIDNDIVIWFDGEAEIGPRSLGHRSLLGDPRKPDTKDRLNYVKKRQHWRPVAPIVLREHVAEWFEDDVDSPYMLQTSNVLTEKKSMVPAIVHYDGSARLQTIERIDKTRALYDLIHVFYSKTSVPMLCNTSLNDKGEPIINTPTDAIRFAIKKGINILYINGKRYQINVNSDYSSLCEKKEMELCLEPQELNNSILSENPYMLDRDVLLWRDYFQYDIKDKKQAMRLKRSVSIIYNNHPEIARLYKFLTNV